MATATPARRRVRYSTLDEVVDDAARAVSAKSATTGKWSLGQILEHLAIANDKMIDGFGFQAPLPIRTVGRYFLKKRLLVKGLTPGFRLNPRAAAVLVPDETDATVALEHLRQSTERLKTEPKRFLPSVSRSDDRRRVQPNVPPPRGAAHELRHRLSEFWCHG